MKGDYGTIHIELGPEITPEQAEAMFDQLCEFTTQWDEKYDYLLTMHQDGPCEDSPHCGGALLRQVSKELRAKASVGTEGRPERHAAIWDAANWLYERGMPDETSEEAHAV